MDARVCFIAMHMDKADVLAWARASGLPEKPYKQKETAERREQRLSFYFVRAHPELVAS